MDSQTIDENIIETPKNLITDIITILDESGSMDSMGNEPVQAVNAFIEEQKVTTGSDNATFTLVTFSDKSRVVIDHTPLHQFIQLEEDDYKPDGGTALNDAVCSTIENEKKDGRPKVVVIITDGYENYSQKYSTTDTKERIEYAEENLGWKFIFLGANIDVFTSGKRISIDKERCVEFDQNCPGDLLLLSRQTSINVNEYRKCRTEGYDEPELVLNSRINKAISCPVDRNELSLLVNHSPDILPVLRLKRVYSVPFMSDLQSPLCPIYKSPSTPPPLDFELPPLPQPIHRTDLLSK
jgi:hypothetical protein